MIVRREPRTSSAEVSAPVITVAIIEDNRLVREGITALLNRFEDIQVVAAHPSGDLQLEQYKPKVILLDLGLENGDSLDVATGIIESYPETRVIVLDLFPADEEIVEFIRAGVAGFVMKDASVEEVAVTIRNVAAGKHMLPAAMTERLFSEITREAVSRGTGREAEGAVEMTPRELEVVGFISEGLSNKAIAKRMDISPHTVKSHLRNIMEKLSLHTRLQVAAYVHEKDLDLPDLSPNLSEVE